jgi:hypothetical protein
MLSWSGHNMNLTVDVQTIASGKGDAGLPHGSELVAFADAIAGYDDLQLAQARTDLVSATSDAFMIDAAAVAANFEMMTRVADGTGATFEHNAHETRVALGNQLGISERISERTPDHADHCLIDPAGSTPPPAA